MGHSQRYVWSIPRPDNQFLAQGIANLHKDQYCALQFLQRQLLEEPLLRFSVRQEKMEGRM